MRLLSGSNKLAQVTVAQERQVGGEQQQPGLGDEREASAHGGHRSGTGRPLSGELDMWIAGQRGKLRTGGPDQDQVSRSGARGGGRNRAEQRPAANLDRWLAYAAQSAGPAAREDERGQLPARGRQISRRLLTSA